MTSETTPAEDAQGRKRLSVGNVVEFLEYLSPAGLSSPDEPYGLQIGDPTSEVRTILVAPMATAEAISLAVSMPGSLLVSASPLITRPLPSIRRDDPLGARVAQLVERRINLYALPNSFAAAPGGFDDSLAEALGLEAAGVLKPTTHERLLKVAVYTPVEAVDAVLKAASEAGAGRLGNYSHCSFQIPGTGTFLPCEGAHPAIGEVGRLEYVQEIRLEMIVQQRELHGVIAAILHAHPYEEVAYDVYALQNPGTPYGRGRIGDLPLGVSLPTILAQIEDALPGSSLRCSHRMQTPITRLAVISGVSDGLVSAAVVAKAGAVVTGHATPQDWMLTQDSGIVLIEVGYPASVVPGLRRLSTQLRKTFGEEGAEVICCA